MDPPPSPDGGGWLPPAGDRTAPTEPDHEQTDTGAVARAAGRGERGAEEQE